MSRCLRQAIPALTTCSSDTTGQIGFLFGGNEVDSITQKSCLGVFIQWTPHESESSSKRNSIAVWFLRTDRFALCKRNDPCYQCSG